MNDIIKKFKLKRKTANARKWKHKEGGKAFVNGINILDSNPNAYKYVKKRYRMHLQGGFFSKIGDFLKSDTGKGILNLGMNLVGQIGNSIKQTKFSNLFDLATDAEAKAIDSKLRASNYKKGLTMAQLEIEQSLILNPDLHFGEIDLILKAKKYADLLYDPSVIEEYKQNRLNEKNQLLLAILGSAGSGILDSIGGIAGSILNSGVLNKEKDTSSNSSNNKDSISNKAPITDTTLLGPMFDPNKALINGQWIDKYDMKAYRAAMKNGNYVNL